MQSNHEAITLHHWDFAAALKAYGSTDTWQRYCADFEAHRLRGLPLVLSPLQLAELLCVRRSCALGEDMHPQCNIAFQWLIIRKALRRLYEMTENTGALYTTHQIPKANGKMRTLHIPQPYLLSLQKKIRHYFLWAMPISRFATAYRRKQGLAENARTHVGKKVLLKLDIRNFFGSITFGMVLRSAFPSALYPPAVGTLLANLCCYKEALPQGAAPSPDLSNIVLFHFDETLGAWCERHGINYTRYSDDMTFSGDFAPGYVIQKVEAMLQKYCFALNHPKTTVRRSGQRQSVTGITVNEKLRVDKQFRKEIRQEMHYCTRFGIDDHVRHRKALHRFVEGEVVLWEHYCRHLLGRISHVLSVDAADGEMLHYRALLRRVLAEGHKLSSFQEENAKIQQELASCRRYGVPGHLLLSGRIIARNTFLDEMLLRMETLWMCYPHTTELDEAHRWFSVKRKEYQFDEKTHESLGWQGELLVL